MHTPIVRSRVALALAMLASGCSLPAGGTFPQAGFGDGEAAVGDEVWARPDDRDLSYSRFNPKGETRHIVSVDGDRVTLNRGEVLPRANVVAPSNLRPGDVVLNMRLEDDSCGTLLRLGSVEMPKVTVVCSGKQMTVDSTQVDLVSREYIAHRRRIFGWLVLFWSGGIIPWVWLRVARRRALRLRDDAEQATSKVRGQLGKQRSGLTALICPGCGGGMQLVEAERTQCIYCRAEVEIPAAYVAFARASTAFRGIAAQHAVVLRSFERLTHPVVPIATGIASAGLFNFVVKTEHSEVEAIVIGRMVLLALAFGMAFSALILAGARIELGKSKEALVAHRRSEGGFACRSCGADLGALVDGVGACSYCGAQNLILTRLAAGEKRLREASADGARTVAHIVAETQLYLVNGLEPVISWVAPACAFFAIILMVAIVVS